MDGATIQQRIYAGRAKAAARIGLACAQYRPLSAAAPLGNLIGTVLAAFNSGDSNYRAPNLPGDPIWYADLDGRLTQPGDYLVRALDGQTWFIAGQQQLLPIIAVNCNRSLMVSRDVRTPTVGAVGYSGLAPATLTPVLGAPGKLWPASVLAGPKKESSSGLPAGVKNANWKVMLPPSVPVTIYPGDILTDDLGQRYSVEAAEQTDTGWRITAFEAHS
ncbi:MAG: hypothetical protein KGL17_03980 [Betaproteobacteria bacterium]|nr:hypothetical protein [Betaproteobacteria bacterium]